MMLGFMLNEATTMNHARVGDRDSGLHICDTGQKGHYDGNS